MSGAALCAARGCGAEAGAEGNGVATGQQVLQAGVAQPEVVAGLLQALLRGHVFARAGQQVPGAFEHAVVAALHVGQQLGVQRQQLAHTDPDAAKVEKQLAELAEAKAEQQQQAEEEELIVHIHFDAKYKITNFYQTVHPNIDGLELEQNLYQN